MKLSPMPASGIPSVSAQGVVAPTGDLRSIKMNTQYTPLQNHPIPDNLGVEAPAATKPIDPQLALIAKQKRALQNKEKEILDREKQHLLHF